MTRAAVLSPSLSKEIRALFPLWAATAAALAAAFVWRQRNLLDAGLLAYVAGSIAIGAQSIGHEYTHRTLPMLLSQPIDRRRVYLLKFGVSSVMLLTLAALAANLAADAWRPDLWPFIVVTILCGFFVAPLLTMLCRSSLAGMILSASVAGTTWVATQAIAWFWFGIGAEAAERLIRPRWTLSMIVLSPLAGLIGWRMFARIEAIETAMPALHLPRWLTHADGTRLHRPLRALVAKELHLQQLTFALAGLYIVGWAAFFLLQSSIPSAALFPIGAAMLLYCMGLAIMIGALASAEERNHGTLDWQRLQPTPAWQQWIVKVGVSLSLAVLLAVGLPVLMIELTPHQGIPALGMSPDFAVLVVLLTASSVYVSSLSSSGVRAMVLTLPIGIGVANFVRTVTAAIAPPSFQPAEVLVITGRTFSLTLVPLLLWFGFVNHTSSERTVRRIFQQVAAVALLIVIGIIVGSYR